ncbi:hypothetical protein BRADI_4g39611v3 [Brachypodium distachyon]|uniref:Epidermal patterning factor-like protein n=1 Tax=Brachypodium distachyon TaxID=15368 RepID=A0A2K2CTD2_BRADI|nr:hypothetical protein BRADI_4g39611v3 [Brachypodium distachyon]
MARAGNSCMQTVGAVVLAMMILLASTDLHGPHLAAASRPAKEAAAGGEPKEALAARQLIEGPSCCSNHEPCPPGSICPRSP